MRALLLACLVLTACDADILGGESPAALGDPASPGTPAGSGGGSAAPAPKPTPPPPAVPAVIPEAKGPVVPGPSPLRRLSHRQLEASVNDLLGTALPLAAGLPREYDDDGYSNQAVVQEPTGPLIEAYAQLAEDVAAKVQQGLYLEPMKSRLLPCAPASATDAACLRQVVSLFLRRAFRRAPSTEELDAFVQLGASEAASTLSHPAGFSWGVSAVVQAALQSPSFLYRLERTRGAAVAAGLPLEGHALAARLSFLVWGTTPDDELLRAADAGELDTPQGLETQAKRLLASPRAREGLGEFLREWLKVPSLATVIKDQKTYPQFTPELLASMAEELGRDGDEVTRDGVDLLSLFRFETSWVDARLAALYGLPAPSGGGFAKVALPKNRRGVLSTAGFLSNNHRTDGSTPTGRGLFLRQRFLCGTINPPPPGVSTTPPPSTAVKTTRQIAEERMQNPVCGSCHQMMDPLGFGLEGFDGIGAARTEENGLPIDDRGQLIASSTVTFQGASELGAAVGALPDTRQCAVRHFVTWSLGRRLTPDDGPALWSLDQQFQAAGNSLPQLVLALVKSDAFRHRSAN